VKTSSLLRHLLALSGHLAKLPEQSPPAIAPFSRPIDEIEPAESYEPETTVWVSVGGDRRRGRVVESAEGVVLVCYYAPGSGDVAIEAVTPSHLLRRKS